MCKALGYIACKARALTDLQADESSYACSHAGLGIAMDGLDLGKRRMKVSMADRKALAKHQHKIAKFSNRESKIPLQVQLRELELIMRHKPFSHSLGHVIKLAI